MTSRLYKTTVAAFLVVAQLFASMAVWNVRAASPVVAECEMSCCIQHSCGCEAAPSNNEEKPAPIAPSTANVELKLIQLLPLIDQLTLPVLKTAEKLPAPDTEGAAVVHEAPLFALHCSYLI